jgi:hypothetical protein
MPISRKTLKLTRALKVTVGQEADAATRTLAGAWVKAWDELSTQMQAAVADVVAEAVKLGRWPHPWELARAERLGTALTHAERTLTTLSERAGVTISGSLGPIVAATGSAEPQIIGSQLPAAEQVSMAARAASKILPSALDAIVARSQSRIVGQARALSGEAMDAMRRSLITGITVGSHPSVVAADMLRRVEGEFNGGLSRAMTIARTELLDGYRTASAYAHSANSDVLDGWRWLATLDSRTCPSCWSKNGDTYPISTPGPWDHPNGRCARMPQVRSWQSLGIHAPEPPSSFPDAQKAFKALPKADQLTIMGPGRLAALNSGQAQWSDLAQRRDSSDWRPSYVATPVRNLTRAA